MRRLAVAATLSAALALPPAASGAIAINPAEAVAGSRTQLDLRVTADPGRDEGTIRVATRMPEGVFFASVRPKRGWRITVSRRRLDTPILVDGRRVDFRIAKIEWRGNPRRGGIVEPDQVGHFRATIRIPDGPAGLSLGFWSYQTYEGGQKIHWTGPLGSPTPAPRLALLAP